MCLNCPALASLLHAHDCYFCTYLKKYKQLYFHRVAYFNCKTVFLVYLKTKKNDFASILSSEGIDGLINKLNKMNNMPDLKVPGE